LAGKAVAVDVGLGLTSAVLLGGGVSVAGAAVGKGVICTVAVGGVTCVISGMAGVSGVLSIHPVRMITNKIKNATLDKFNIIKGPFVTRWIVFLVLELRPEDYS
jgi:hypothetical protein